MIATTTPGFDEASPSTWASSQSVLGVDIDDEVVGTTMLMISASGTAVRLG